MTFFEIAAPLISFGFKVIRLQSKTKRAIDNDWPNLATTDENVIRRWSQESPDANCACVADHRLGGLLFVEIDSPAVVERYKAETGERLPNTFRVRSSPGRGHLYLLNTAYSLANLPNISQGAVKFQDFSVRVDHAYCVSPGSIHPTSGLPYEVLYSGQVLEIPNRLVDWILAQRENKPDIDLSLDGEKIPRGTHDVTLTKIAGKLRSSGMSPNSIATALTEICESRCIDYGSDYKEMCEKIAKSIGSKPIKDDTVLINGRPAGSSVIVEPEVPLAFKSIPYPVFPKWVMDGTSVYEGFVKPVCEQNSRYPEFMFMPSVVLLLNYVGTKVRLKHNPSLIPSIFLTMIGRKGRVIKSSSVEDAITYFSIAGVADHSSSAKNNAEGKSLVFSAGSPEGLGLEMSRTNCKNAILFYDELSLLTNKASIDGSALTSSLLALYESGKFQNIIKSRKESFAFEPGSYCASLIACCTEQNFQTHWSRLAGKTSGLDDRFFFLYQPENFIDVTPQIGVNTIPGSVETRKRIDKAVSQGVYEIERLSGPLKKLAKSHGNRAEIRAEKFALFFAIDLARDIIDDDCVERAVELVKYEYDVKKYVETFEAITKEGVIQQQIFQLLKKGAGTVYVRDINRVLHPERYGSTMWSNAYNGMIRSGWVREEGKGLPGDPQKLIALWYPEEDE